VNKSTVLLALGFLLPTIGVILFLTIFPLLNILGILLAFGGLAALVAGKVLETPRIPETPAFEEKESSAQTVPIREEDMKRLRRAERALEEIMQNLDKLVCTIAEQPSLLGQIASDQAMALESLEEITREIASMSEAEVRHPRIALALQEMGKALEESRTQTEEEIRRYQMICVLTLQEVQRTIAEAKT